MFFCPKTKFVANRAKAAAIHRPHQVQALQTATCQPVSALQSDAKIRPQAACKMSIRSCWLGGTREMPKQRLWICSVCFGFVRQRNETRNAGLRFMFPLTGKRSFHWMQERDLLNPQHIKISQAALCKFVCQQWVLPSKGKNLSRTMVQELAGSITCWLLAAANCISYMLPNQPGFRCVPRIGSFTSQACDFRSRSVASVKAVWATITFGCKLDIASLLKMFFYRNQGAGLSL